MIVGPNTQAVGTGAAGTLDIDVRRMGTLGIIARLIGTVTVGDFTLFTVRSYFPAPSAAVIPVILLPKSVQAAASDGANVGALQTYDVTGLEKVQVSVTNANAGTLNLQLTYFAEYAGRI